MAALFGSETPILSYGPKSHANPGKRNEREYVIWPAWAFHVIAPKFESLHFNELQKAILGVLRASQLTASELSACLGIHSDLAAFIVTEMQDKGWIDKEWTVTSYGRKLLEDELEMQASLVSGWVFKDPWQENLWPFVAPSLEYAGVEWDEKGNRVLDLGTTKRSWLQKLWRQDPSYGPVPSPPSVNEILRAALLQEQFKNGLRYIEVQDHEELETSEIPGLDLKRITSIDANPEPVFLMSYLYVPQDGDDRDLDWHACDFFGRGSDPTLRRFVAREAGKNQNLARRLDRLLNHTLLYTDFNDFKRIDERRKDQARKWVQQALTRNIDKFGVAQPLTELLEGWLELRCLEKGEMAGLRHRRNVLLACRSTIEYILGDIAREWSFARVTNKHYDQKINFAVLQAAAEEIGLTPPPEALRWVRPLHIKKIITKPQQQQWRLRALLAATLLLARVEENHPLRTAAKNSPDILVRIDHVANRGGDAVHKYKQDLDFPAVAGTVRETLEIVGLLLNLPTGNIEGILQDAT